MKRQNKFFGKHLIYDFKCDLEAEIYENVEIVNKFFIELLNELKNNVVYSSYYKFYPYGLTLCYILAESSFTYHTYREFNNLISIDFYTCNLNTDFNKFIEKVNEFFKVNEILKKELIYRKT